MNQKLQIIAQSRINSRGRINSTRQQWNMYNQLCSSRFNSNHSRSGTKLAVSLA